MKCIIDEKNAALEGQSERSRKDKFFRAISSRGQDFHPGKITRAFIVQSNLQSHSHRIVSFLQGYVTNHDIMYRHAFMNVNGP